ncbi:hypothetical protein PHISCL_01943 [Aspergillus sclerotialis]|uniref:Uncharacterized protein n=1 Tax=Aspergillus sclerotialis TaxID=2070753 RepID=A0A3A3A701_9EURO|nr:hypothetical protein PHISCL_01943 [Aspergillus sclerotialis]
MTGVGGGQASARIQPATTQQARKHHRDLKTTMAKQEGRSDDKPRQMGCLPEQRFAYLDAALEPVQAASRIKRIGKRVRRS